MYDSFYHIKHLKALKPILAVPQPYIYFVQNVMLLMVTSSQMTSFVSSLKQGYNREAGKQKAILHECILAIYCTMFLHSRIIDYVIKVLQMSLKVVENVVFISVKQHKSG